MPRKDNRLSAREGNDFPKNQYSSPALHQQDLPRTGPKVINNPQVIEYLLKKGYTKTEQTLRQESKHLDKDGRPIAERLEDKGDAKYAFAFNMISKWVEQNLDIYKVSMLEVVN